MKLVVVAILAALICAPAHAQETPLSFYAGASFGAGGTSLPVSSIGEGDTLLPAAGAFAGFDAYSGTMLFGIEASVGTDIGKIDLGGAYQITQFSAPYPRLRSSLVGPVNPGPPPSTFGTVPGGQQSQAYSSYNYAEILARPMLSFRVGTKTGDWTIYGKLGGGAAFVRSTNVFDESASVFCTSTTTRTDFTLNSQTTYDLGCNGPYSGPIAKTSSTSLRPAVSAAIGSEYDFHPYFARAEAEISHIFFDAPSIGQATGITQFKINGGLGIRF